MNDLKKGLLNVERLAKGSKFSRLIHHPLKYLISFGIQRFLYPYLKTGLKITTKTFYNKKMTILLPSGTDIYLTGGKSHISEIRLAKFILNHLNKDDTFIDIGAHYGYFTLLASEVVGVHGKVLAYEASRDTFSILRKNTFSSSNIIVQNMAVSDSNGELDFYEFPVKYSEYNAADIRQYENEKWFKKVKPRLNKIPCIKLEQIVEEYAIVPKMIKIDVEGAEFRVLSGAAKLLSSHHDSTIIMEYLAANRGNSEHQKAKMLLEELGFQCFVIDDNGELVHVNHVDEYLEENKIDSDNLVFKR